MVPLCITHSNSSASFICHFYLDQSQSWSNFNKSSNPSILLARSIHYVSLLFWWGAGYEAHWDMSLIKGWHRQTAASYFPYNMPCHRWTSKQDIYTFSTEEYQEYKSKGTKHYICCFLLTIGLQVSFSCSHQQTDTHVLVWEWAMSHPLLQMIDCITTGNFRWRLLCGMHVCITSDVHYCTSSIECGRQRICFAQHDFFFQKYMTV